MNRNDQTTMILRKTLIELESCHSDLLRELAQCSEAMDSIRDRLSDKTVSVGCVPALNGSFAAKVRGAIVKFGQTAAPKEIADLLIESGYEYPGKSDFGSVVANELFRQAKSNKSPIVKVGRGQYQAVPAKETK